MQVTYDRETMRVPLKLWARGVDETCTEQFMNLANLPFVYRHVAGMPDAHGGYGMPIGGVIACDGVILPYGVGNDIGCGMAFVQTNVPYGTLQTETGQGTLGQALIGAVMRNIPVGPGKAHKEPKPCTILDGAPMSRNYTLLKDAIDKAYYQLGTLGGGNHFIELQKDENDMITLMVHSGSRGLGATICKLFNQKAKELNDVWYSDVDPSWNLAFLPIGQDEGGEYVHWMHVALQYAKLNRMVMMQELINIFANMVKKYDGFKGIELDDELDCHHNYATTEHHFGRNVMVHRKGAVRARVGDRVIIPGAMGRRSFIGIGKGNPESFMSCSHGAGRLMSRKQAKANYSVQETIEELKRSGTLLGKTKKEDVAEESPMAYKDIEEVMELQQDLVEPVKTLQSLITIKG